MPLTTLEFSPGKLHRNLSLADGVTRLDFTGVGIPARRRKENISAHLVCAVTPTGSTVSISFDGSGGLTITGGTARISSVVGDGISNAAGFHVRLWARRKPGTTGTIAAQTLTLKGGASAANTLGKIFVAAAAASAEPVSDVLDLQRFASGDTEFTIDSSDPAVIAVSAGADPDLEIVFEAYGLGL